MFELYNAQLELMGYGSYESLKLFALAEHLNNYSIIAIGC